MPSASFEPDENLLDRRLFVLRGVLGAVAVLVGHATIPAIAYVVQFFSEDLSLAAVLLVGLTQLVYVVPMLVVSAVKGWRGAAIGIVLVATVTFLLNAACWGLFMVVLQNGIH